MAVLTKYPFEWSENEMCNESVSVVKGVDVTNDRADRDTVAIIQDFS